MGIWRMNNRRTHASHRPAGTSQVKSKKHGARTASLETEGSSSSGDRCRPQAGGHRKEEIRALYDRCGMDGHEVPPKSESRLPAGDDLLPSTLRPVTGRISSKGYGREPRGAELVDQRGVPRWSIAEQETTRCQGVTYNSVMFKNQLHCYSKAT